MAVLLDQYGRPIDLSKLKNEQAGASTTGVRQIISGHPAQGLTPQRLARLLREAETGDATRYLELAEEMEEKDLHYLGVMGTRKRAVAQLEITVEPASDSAEHKRHAELIELFLKREELEDELCDLLDAIGKGYSVTEIIWETSARQWMPQRLAWRFPQWFEFDRETGSRLLLHTEAGREELAPYKFITHVHKAKSGLAIRGGFARAVAWGYLFKNYTIKDWVAFAEIYGQPLRVGRYHAGATPDDKEKLLEAVANIGTDAAAIIPQSMLIEFIETQKTGTSDLYKGLAEYIDKQISKAVLGQTLTTEIQGGSLAGARVHEGVKDDIERADSKQLAATLNRDLARPMVDLNFGPQKLYPRIRIGRTDQVNVAELSEALAKLVPLGLEVAQSEVRDKIGVSEPDAGEDILRAPAAPTLTEPVDPADPAPDPAGPAEKDRAEKGQASARAGDPDDDPDDDDSLDQLITEELARGGWEKLMGPAVDEIMGLARDAKNFEEFRAALATSLDGDALDTIVESIARTAFAARVAGNVEADISDNQNG